jgi:RNA polymerase sigma factor (TIGR02999 family)
MDERRTDDLSTVLEAVRSGQDGAEDRLFDLVYHELRRMAHARMARERPGQTLQTTALVHEAFLKLQRGGDPGWENRRHFFGAAARAMRQILIDRALKKRAARHGGDVERVPLDDNIPDAERPEDLLALDEALDRLAADRPKHAEVVLYRYFLGLTIKDTAELLEVATGTVDNRWAFAKAWLRREVGRHES